MLTSSCALPFASPVNSLALPFASPAIWVALPSAEPVALLAAPSAFFALMPMVSFAAWVADSESLLASGLGYVA